MSKAFYIPTPQELSAIMSGRQTAFSVLVKPLIGATGVKDVYHRPDGLFIGLHLPVGIGVGITTPFQCHYQPGSLIAIKESWRKYSDVGCCEMLEFAADGHEPIYEVDGDGFQVFNKDGTERMIPWHSPVTMPKSAVRLWVRVGEVVCKRIQDITNDEIIAHGNYGTFYKDWQDKNGSAAYINNAFIFIINFKIEKV